MKRVLFMTACWVGLLSASSRAVQVPVYTVLSDKGTVGDGVSVWGPAAGDSVHLDGTVTTPAPPEGFHAMQATALVPTNFSGPAPWTPTWAVMYLQPDGVTPRAVDLSQYKNGEIRFWANCTTDNFEIMVEHLDGSQDGYSYLGSLSALNQWVPESLPLTGLTAAGVTLTDLSSPFVMNMGFDSGGAQLGTCYIDNIRYVTTPGVEISNVTPRNLSNGLVATQLTWNSTALPAGWVRADQYLELDTDFHTLGWGVQIYTDNTNSPNPNSKFVSPVPVGQPGSNPAGLVADTPQHSQVLPLAWTIKSTLAPSPQTPTDPANPPLAAEPNDNGTLGHPSDINAFQWLYMEDAKTPTIPPDGTSLGSTAFQNGQTFVTVKNNQGNHYGQRDTDFGAENTPTYIFLEANFSSASTPRTYQTNTLTVEFFYQ